jgi:hypothetical protein
MTGFFLAALPMTGAGAAPQALGLLATGETPVELKCIDGVCSAEFSAFCLQQDRTVPKNGTAYRQTEGSKLRLVFTGPDGAHRAVPASGLTIRSVRGFAAVVVSVPEAVMKAAGAERIALSVAEPAVLAPHPIANDRAPQTPGDLVAAAEQLRRVGTAPIDDGSAFSHAFRGMMAMINTLPDEPEALGSEGGDTARQVLKRRTMPVEARVFTSEQLDYCEVQAAGALVVGGLRACLQRQHDSLVGSLNRNYWKATKPGS